MKNFLLVSFVFLSLFVCAQDIQSNLVAYLPFNGDTKDQVTTKSGTFNAAYVSFAEGKYGQAVSFAGGADGSYVVFKESDFSLPMKNSAYSISLWLKSGSVTGLGILVSWGVNGITSGTNNQLVQFCANADGTVRSGLWGNDFNVPVNVNTGEWVHVATTYGNKTCSVYVNGVLQLNGALPNFEEPGITTNPSDMWTIGALNSPIAAGAFGSWSAYNGSIDEVRIYSRALTAADIAALFAYNPSGSLVSNPKFNKTLQINKIDNSLEINYQTNKNQEVLFSLYHTNGKLIKSKQISSLSGPQQTTMDIPGLDAGIYLLKTKIDGLVQTSKISLR